MRILFAIAHYWRPLTLRQTIIHLAGKAPVEKLRRLARQFIPNHASLQCSAATRAEALQTLVCRLHWLFGKRQWQVNRPERRPVSTNLASASSIDIVICTTGDAHVLDQLDLPSASFSNHPTTSDPRFLSFECQALLGSRLAQYDYYCFLEDDILLSDPSFFQKLQWFNNQFGDACIIQPNRFETSSSGGFRKLYIDETLRPEVSKPFQDVNDQPELFGEVMGKSIRFIRTTNPHSGCYFLTSKQMALWAGKPGFPDRDSSFVGPLESGATLGVMCNFRIYKPALENASFLEVEHPGDYYLRTTLDPLLSSNPENVRRTGPSE
jgi:hypothetical protein